MITAKICTSCHEPTPFVEALSFGSYCGGCFRKLMQLHARGRILRVGRLKYGPD